MPHSETADSPSKLGYSRTFLHRSERRPAQRTSQTVRFEAARSGQRGSAPGRLPAYTNGGWSAPRFMKLGCRKAETRHRLNTLPSGPRKGPPPSALLVKGYLTLQIDQPLGRAYPVSPLSRAKERTLARP